MMGNMRLVFLFTPLVILILISLSLPTTLEGLRRQKPRRMGLKIFKDNNKPACKQQSFSDHGSTFCEQAQNYPKRLLERMIKNSNLSVVSKEFFVDRQKLDIRTVINRSMGDEDYMCPSMLMTKLPQMAQTTKGEWKYIANHGNLSQAVEVEMCYETGPCRLLESVQDKGGVPSQCEQKVIAKKLFSYDESQKLIWESFIFPSACVCTYTTRPVLFNFPLKN